MKQIARAACSLEVQSVVSHVRAEAAIEAVRRKPKSTWAQLATELKRLEGRDKS
jgi:hypothetical protein